MGTRPVAATFGNGYAVVTCIYDKIMVGAGALISLGGLASWGPPLF